MGPGSLERARAVARAVARVAAPRPREAGERGGWTRGDGGLGRRGFGTPRVPCPPT